MLNNLAIGICVNLFQFEASEPYFQVGLITSKIVKSEEYFFNL